MMPSYEIAQLVLLSDSYLFAALDDHERRRLAASGETRAFAAGETIVRQGEPGDAFYMVKRGRVRVTAERGGETVELATLGRGSCFGEMALLQGTPRTATVAAVEPCEVVEYTKGDVEQVLAQNPAVRQALDVLVRRRSGER